MNTLLYMEMKSLLSWSIVMVYCYGYGLLLQSIVMQFITALKFNRLQLKAYKGYL